MFKAVDVKATKRYVSPNDPNKDNPTVFIIGSIDPALRSFIDGKCSAIEMDDKNKSAKRLVRINTTQYSMLTFKYGLRGIENFFAADGVTPLFLATGNHNIAGVSYPCVTDDFIPYFHPDLISEVADEIVKFQSLNGEEIKN